MAKLNDGREVPIPGFKIENERSHKLTAGKARLMLREGEVRGHALTERQRGLFGLIAGGGRPTRIKRK